MTTLRSTSVMTNDATNERTRGMKKGITGTHYKPTGRREATLSIRVTEDELQIIKDKAAASGMTVTTYVVTCCTTRKVKGYNPGKIANEQLPGQMSLQEMGVIYEQPQTRFNTSGYCESDGQTYNP